MPVRRISGKYVPGQMGARTIEELGKLQSEFLKEITASPETNRKAREAYPDWVNNGTRQSSS